MKMDYHGLPGFGKTWVVKEPTERDRLDYEAELCSDAKSKDWISNKARLVRRDEVMALGDMTVWCGSLVFIPFAWVGTPRKDVSFSCPIFRELAAEGELVIQFEEGSE